MVVGKAKRKSKTTRYVLVACLVIVLIAAFFGYRALRGSSSATITYRTEAAATMTILQTVSGTGNVSLTNTASISPTISGVVDGLKVQVGDTVKKGQVLFTVVNTDLDLAVTQATNSYDQALSSLGNAQLSALKAQQSLDDLETARTQQQWGTPTGSVDIGELASFQNPTSYGMVQLASLQVTPPSVTTTTTEPPTSTTTVPSTTTTTISDLDIAIAQQQVTSAQLGVTVAQTSVDSAKLSLQQAQENAAARTVTATLDGTVSAVNVANGDQLGSSNSSSSSGSNAPIVITDLNSWNISVTLAETDIVSVAAGQKVTLTFDALPDLTLAGKVLSVDPTGVNNQGVVSYTATIVPDVTNPQVRGSMTATANIITDVAADVIGVPNAAVKSQSDGTHYVQLLEKGAPVDQTVEIGIANDSYTQITSGLTVGQEVITQTINSSASTVTTTRGAGSILGTGGGGGGVRIGGPPAGF